MRLITPFIRLSIAISVAQGVRSFVVVATG